MKKKLLQITSFILLLSLTACSSKKETVHEETSKETLVETKEESIKETVKETHKETKKESLQETVKETQKETVKETLKETQKEDMDSLIEKEEKKGKMVATGQVKVFSHKELAKYQNFEQLADMDSGQSYVVMILDKPVDITVIAGDGNGHLTRKAELIGLPLDFSKYNGQTITISFGSDDGHWQSDASLPMNAPRMGDVKVLR